MSAPEELAAEGSQRPPADSSVGTWQLVCRYFLFWLLLSPPTGDVYLQRAHMQENFRRMRRWLPHYVKVHLFCFACFAGAVCTAESLELWLATGLLSILLAIETFLLVFTCSVWAVAWFEQR